MTTLPQRGLRLAALVVQAVLVALLLLLLGLAAWPTLAAHGLQAMFGWWWIGDLGVPSWPLLLDLGVALIVVGLGVFLASWRLQGRSWLRIALGYVALAGVLAYLAHDDAAIRHPLPIEEISPVFPGAEASYAVLMRYGKAQPLGRNFKAPNCPVALELARPIALAQWRDALHQHRAELEANWAALAPVRAWWTELSAFDRIGDLTPTRADADIPAFQPLRTLAQHGVAIARLQAVDGHGDDAIDTLVPILQVARRLQPYSRTLVRTMMAIVIERMSLQTATFILDDSTVSPAARARLAAALQAGDPAAGARHLMSMEYAFHLGVVDGKRLGAFWAEVGPGRRHPGLVGALNAVSPFLYNPRATSNLYGDLCFDQQDLVGRRQLDQLEPRMKRFREHDARPTFKNFLGKLIMTAVTPPYSKVAESYWTTQDQRAALLARVTQP